MYNALVFVLKKYTAQIPSTQQIYEFLFLEIFWEFESLFYPLVETLGHLDPD